MNKKQNKLFDLVNDSSHDMEDLIETISYKEVDRLIEVWEENIRELNAEIDEERRRELAQEYEEGERANKILDG